MEFTQIKEDKREIKQKHFTEWALSILYTLRQDSVENIVSSGN